MTTDCSSGIDAIGSYIFQDIVHFGFIYFGAFLTAIVLVFNPNWAFNIWLLYILNLVCGLFGVMTDELVQLCWGWYIHAIVMIMLTIPMSLLTKDS